MAVKYKSFSTKDFANPCRGVWRYILAANACYEIVVIRAKDSGELSINDKAYGYVSGVWTNESTRESYYERECLTGAEPVTVEDCLTAFQRDYNGLVVK